MTIAPFYGYPYRHRIDMVLSPSQRYALNAEICYPESQSEHRPIRIHMVRGPQHIQLVAPLRPQEVASVLVQQTGPCSHTFALAPANPAMLQGDVTLPAFWSKISSLSGFLLVACTLALTMG